MGLSQKEWYPSSVYWGLLRIEKTPVDVTGAYRLGSATTRDLKVGHSQVVFVEILFKLIIFNHIGPRYLPQQ